jgi:hypothetical protein
MVANAQNMCLTEDVTSQLLAQVLERDRELLDLAIQTTATAGRPGECITEHLAVEVQQIWCCGR